MEGGNNSSFRDDSARRQEDRAGVGKVAGRTPSLGRLPSGARRTGVDDPGLAFSTKQREANSSAVGDGGAASGTGAAALQRQMAQMASAMAGMGGTGPGAAVASMGGGGGGSGGGFGATSVVLWEVMSLVLMRSVLSSAVGAMSSQMTGIAQQVGNNRVEAGEGQVFSS